ncbi:MAG: hypothetical protein MZU95_10080 [Desulfomicrobium escambiense]|nr:hypothetical protein [Desulfomicrobium escambiense]
MEFDVPLGKAGDTYDRYRCRMEELRQSNKIIRQCIEKLPRGAIIAPDAPKYVLPSKDLVLANMESLIHQFILITKGPIGCPAGSSIPALRRRKASLVSTSSATVRGILTGCG